NFIRYQTLSKQTEVRVTLSSARIGAQSYAERSADSGKMHFPPGSTGWVPEGPCGSSGCQGDASAFSKSPWADLAFSPPSHQPRYQYRYTSTDPGNTTFELSAQGDLDGNGKLDVWKLSGRIGADGNAVVDAPEEVTPGEF